MLFSAIVVGGYFAITYNVLLGKWTAPADEGPPFAKTKNSAAVKGFEFFRSRRFSTFGMEINGRSIDYYGKYHFLGSNLISLEIKGFRGTLTNKVFDLPLKGSIFESLMKPQVWKLSDDGQSLEETEYFGDGVAPTFYKEPRIR